jgi:fluoroacetyl-CoA thioesterase
VVAANRTGDGRWFRSQPGRGPSPAVRWVWLLLGVDAYRGPVPVKPGLSADVQLVVTEADTAIALRSGSVAVLATPRLIALCEEASMRAVGRELDEGLTTVGMKVQLDHLAPTAVGESVRAEATVERVNGRRVTFTVSVNDNRGLVAVGRITRVIVDTERFMERTR